MKAQWRSLFLSVTVAFVGTLLLTIITLSGVATEINLSLQNVLTSLSPKPEPEFAIVELPDEQSAVSELLTTVYESSPKRIFWVLPDAPPTPIQQQLITQYQILPLKVPSYQFTPQGKLKQTSTSPWQPGAGYLLDVEESFGIARLIPRKPSTEELLVPPVQALHGEALHESGEPSLDERFWQEQRYIDFNNVAINTPVLNKGMSTQTSVVSELVKNLDVYLVGDFQLGRARIKIANGQQGIPWHPIQYHAAAIVAWEHNHYQVNLPSWFKWILALTMSSVLILVFLYSPVAMKRLITASATLLTFLIVLLMCTALNYVAPITELAIVALFLSLLAEINFDTQRTLLLKQMNRLLAEQINDKQIKSSELKNFWQQVASMISQNLHLQRTIFFQLPRGKFHLQEISALNCQLTDISEMRRDIRRSPYAEAIDAKQAVDSSRPYFKDRVEGEFEIMVPLFRGTVIIGFWALTTKESDSKVRNQLKEQANLLATQISVLLELQQQESQGERQAANTIRHFGNMQQRELQRVCDKLTTLGAYTDNHRALFKAMSTPAVLFDVFGQSSMVNTAMQQINRVLPISPDSANAFDFLQQILPINPDTLRNTIRQLTLERNLTHNRFFVTLGSEDFIVILSSVQREEENLFNQKANLQVSGLLCEFHSLQKIQNHLQIERDLYDDYLIRIKDHLSTLQMGLLQIERKAQDPELNQIIAYLNLELKKSSDITRRTHNFTHKIAERKQPNALPFSPIQVIRKVLASVQENEKDSPNWRDVKFDCKLPTFANPGLGSPDNFQHLIQCAFRLLADDAMVPKLIKVTCKQVHQKGRDVLYFKCESEGYGLPNEQLQKMFQQNLVLGENSLLTELLIALQNAKDAGMECRLSSRVGKGYRLSILIEGISLDE